jgi:hypothetical protein
MDPASSASSRKEARDNSQAIESPDASSGSLPPATAPAGGTTSTTPPQRSPSQSSLGKTGSASASSASHPATHRQSFAENLRNVPSSPRSARHPSFTQSAVQELFNHPPTPNKHSNPRFAGRDWRDISVGELVTAEDVKWVDLDTSVEDATMVRTLLHLLPPFFDLA